MPRNREQASPLTAHVIMRDCDVDSVCLILAHMRDMGILIGKGNTSAAIRYALGWCADTITADSDAIAHGDDQRHRTTQPLLVSTERRRRRPDDDA